MHLIFDFDGTLVDSFKNAAQKLIQLADEFNFRKVHVDEIDKLRDLNSKELIKYLQIPTYKVPKIIYQLRKSMQDEILLLPPCGNLPNILAKLHDEKISLGILTSNSAENVTPWLKNNNLYHFFSFIHTESSYFGKKTVLKKLLKMHQIDKSKTFYLGDETRDIDAAKQSNIYSIATTWGFNSEKALLQHQPDYLAKNPDDILTICELHRENTTRQKN